MYHSCLNIFELTYPYLVDLQLVGVPYPYRAKFCKDDDLSDGGESACGGGMAEHQILQRHIKISEIVFLASRDIEHIIQ
jgi:hypothetical protein